jgi:hypothetical protein
MGTDPILNYFLIVLGTLGIVWRYFAKSCLD